MKPSTPVAQNPQLRSTTPSTPRYVAAPLASRTMISVPGAKNASAPASPSLGCGSDRSRTTSTTPSGGSPRQSPRSSRGTPIGAPSSERQNVESSRRCRCPEPKGLTHSRVPTGDATSPEGAAPQPTASRTSATAAERPRSMMERIVAPDGLREMPVMWAWTRGRARADVSRQASPVEMLGGFRVRIMARLAIQRTSCKRRPVSAMPRRLGGIDSMHRSPCRASMRSVKGANEERPQYPDDPCFACFASSQDGPRTPIGVASSPCFISFACSHAVPFLVHLPFAGTRKRTQRLMVAIGRDDDGSPCVTIGFPGDF